MKINDPTSQYNGYYGYLGTPAEYTILQFTADKTAAVTFTVDSSGHLLAANDDPAYPVLVGQQDPIGQMFAGNQVANVIIFSSEARTSNNPAFTCTVATGTGVLACSEANVDERSILKVCLQNPENCNDCQAGVPAAILDTQQDTCPTTIITLVAA